MAEEQLRLITENNQKALIAEEQFQLMAENNQDALRMLWITGSQPRPINDIKNTGVPVVVLSDDGIREDGVKWGGDGRFYIVIPYPRLLALMGVSYWKPLGRMP